MFRLALIAMILSAGVSPFVPAAAPVAPPQNLDDSIISRHVRMRLPVERQWLGRETINSLESCWAFLDAATNASLPERVMIVLNIQNAITVTDQERGTITIGLADPMAAKDVKGFLIHAAAREMARMALTNLSGGGAAKAEHRFLLEGMSVMLAHEYANNVRKLTAAWTVAHCLDRIRPLGLKQLSSAGALSGAKYSLFSVAPGITFMTTANDLYGRNRVLRLFESLARRNLDDSIAAAFRTSADALEGKWLERLRKYSPEDFTVTPADAVPVLDRIQFAPDPAPPGAPLLVRLYAHDSAADLSAAGIFLIDETSGRIAAAAPAGASPDLHMQFELPIAADCREGQHRIRVIAVDEAGNVRNWNAYYAVKRQPAGAI